MNDSQLFELIENARKKDQKAQTKLINVFWIDVFSFVMKKIANENEALEYIYANPKQGALYTIMCDVVAGALDKIKELKDREDNS